MLGIIGGALGALFISMSTNLSFLRKKIITTNRKRVCETGMFGLMTISVMVMLVIYAGECKKIQEF